MMDTRNRSDAGSPELLACAVCGTANTPDSRYCHGCWLPLDHATAITSGEARRRREQTRRSARARRLAKRAAMLAVIAGLALLAYGDARPSPPPLPAAPHIESGSPAGQWTMSGHDPGNTRYSPDVPQFNGRLKWRFAAGGPFFASPTATADAVYAATGDRGVVALDARDGSLIWETVTGVPVDSAPAVAAGHVYVGLRDGRVLALDQRSGGIVWQYRSDSPITADPVVASGTVYVGDGGGRLLALDAQTGTLRWRTDRRTTEGIGLAVAVSGNNVVAVAAGAVRIYDAAKGRQVAEHRLATVITADPVAIGSEVYVGAGGGTFRSIDPSWRPPFLYRGIGRRVWLYTYLIGFAPRPPSGFLWGRDLGPGDIRRMAVTGDSIYFATSFGRVTAVDRSTHKPRWTYDMSASGYGATIVAGKIAYAGDITGALYALDTETGELRWKLQTGGAIKTSPAANESGVYVAGSDGVLYAIE